MCKLHFFIKLFTPSIYIFISLLLVVSFAITIAPKMSTELQTAYWTPKSKNLWLLHRKGLGMKWKLCVQAEQWLLPTATFHSWHGATFSFSLSLSEANFLQLIFSSNSFILSYEHILRYLGMWAPSEVQSDICCRTNIWPLRYIHTDIYIYI